MANLPAPDSDPDPDPDQPADFQHLPDHSELSGLSDEDIAVGVIDEARTRGSEPGLWHDSDATAEPRSE
jgi:hypothetical protein